MKQLTFTWSTVVFPEVPYKTWILRSRPLKVGGKEETIIWDATENLAALMGMNPLRAYDETSNKP